MSRTVGCATLGNTPTNRLRGRARGSVVGAGKGHSDDPHHPLPCAHDAACHMSKLSSEGSRLFTFHSALQYRTERSLRRPRVSRLIYKWSWWTICNNQYGTRLCLFSRGHWSPREDRVKLARDWLRRGGLARVALGREGTHRGDTGQPRPSWGERCRGDGDTDGGRGYAPWPTALSH